MSDRKLGESHFARINSEKRKLNERSQGAKWKRKIILLRILERSDMPALKVAKFLGNW